MVWKQWRPKMILFDKELRITGSEKQYNEGRNYYDGRTYRLPGGLTGKIQSISPFKVVFRESDNRSLWRLIAPAWTEPALYVEIPFSRLSGCEIDE